MKIAETKNDNEQQCIVLENKLMNEKQKRKLLSVFAIILVIAVFAIFSSCNSPAEKVDKAEVSLLEAEQDLDKAEAKYHQNVENYRLETRNKIEANNEQITQLKRQIDGKKKATKAEYNKQIDELEQKNKEMERRMNSYKANSKDDWESFKDDFSKEMDKLGNSLNNFFTNS